LANRPDIIIKNKKDKTCLLIDVAIPSDKKVPILSTQLLHYKWIIIIKISPETTLVPCNSHTKSSEQGPTQLSKFVFHIDLMMSKLSTQVHNLYNLINPNKISHSC
jgi:hypothetical protein